MWRLTTFSAIACGTDLMLVPACPAWGSEDD